MRTLNRSHCNVSINKRIEINGQTGVILKMDLIKAKRN